jgi:hypothetical protein
VAHIYTGGWRLDQRDAPRLKMLRLALRQLAVLALASAVAGFHWPNPTLEAYDALRWDQAGAHSGLLGPAVTPCSRFEGTGEASGNQTNAAQWLRTVKLFLLLTHARRLTLRVLAGVPRHGNV